MKKFILSFVSASIIGLSSYAQSFEGQITYKIEVKGENAAMFTMMMPNSTDIFILGKDVLVRNNGGMASSKLGDIITKADGNTYMVVHSKKTVYKMDSKKEKNAEAPTVTKEGTETVNGYNCTKYLVKFPKTEKAEIYQYMWCSTDIKIQKPSPESNAQLFLKEVEGFPVKMDQYITISAMGTTMSINQEMVLDKISEVKPDAAMFEIPKKYKVEDFDETKMGQ
jgi:hypothetical protein